MKRTIRLDGRTIEYTLERKRVKNVNLRVRGGELFVSAARWVPLAVIEGFLRERGGYILRAIERAEKAPSLTFEDGAALPWLGRELTLVLERGTKTSVRVEGGFLRAALRTPEDPEAVRRALEKCYRAESERLCRACLERLYPHFASLGVPPPEVKMRVMRAAWGNCRPKSGVMTFNASLAAVPEKCIEYVVAHELCHFLHADHSAAFYAALGRVIPDWKTRRAALRPYSALL
jgi:hypothetical protein